MPMTLFGRHNPLASPAEQLKVLTGPVGCPPFERRLDHAGLFPLRASGMTVLQINVGKLCNQTCRHCHVDAGPDRTETMSKETAQHCMAALGKTDIPTVDITGGAPELNPIFSLARQASSCARPSCGGSLQSVCVAASLPSRSCRVSNRPPRRNHRVAAGLSCRSDRCSTG